MILLELFACLNYIACGRCLPKCKCLRRFCKAKNNTSSVAATDSFTYENFRQLPDTRKQETNNSVEASNEIGKNSDDKDIVSQINKTKGISTLSETCFEPDNQSRKTNKQNPNDVTTHFREGKPKESDAYSSEEDIGLLNTQEGYDADDELSLNDLLIISKEEALERAHQNEARNEPIKELQTRRSSPGLAEETSNFEPTQSTHKISAPNLQKTTELRDNSEVTEEAKKKCVCYRCDPNENIPYADDDDAIAKNKPVYTSAFDFFVCTNSQNIQ